MGYKGLEITSQKDYIFDTIPYNPEFDLEELKSIEDKLKNYTSGKSIDGLTPKEAETFLDWITFNARSYAVSNTPESAITASMKGQCAPTQKLNVELLRKFGLDARPFNTADCIGEIPISEENMRRVQNGLLSPAVRHSVSLVSIPIIDNNGNTAEYKYLLDPTFRQFCLNENCTDDKFTDKSWLDKGYVAPHPGYFMKAQNLPKLGVDSAEAQKTEALGKLIVSRGYCYLNDENAKLYVDAFRRASINREYQYLASENVSGNKYIWNFENNPMKMTTLGKADGFLKLPSEIEQKKQGVFSKIKNYFKNIFNRNQIKALPAGGTKEYSEDLDPYTVFKKQYEAKGIVQGAEIGKVQHLDQILNKNNVERVD